MPEFTGFEVMYSTGLICMSSSTGFEGPRTACAWGAVSVFAPRGCFLTFLSLWWLALGSSQFRCMIDTPFSSFSLQENPWHNIGGPNDAAAAPEGSLIHLAQAVALQPAGGGALPVGHEGLRG